MKKKYLVLPGEVYSSDGQTHFISAYDLMRLYLVNPEECVSISKESDLFCKCVDEWLAMEFLMPLRSCRYPIFGYSPAMWGREQKLGALSFHRFDED